MNTIASDAAVTVAITTGEPAGVGPELTLAAIAKIQAAVRGAVQGDGGLDAHARHAAADGPAVSTSESGSGIETIGHDGPIRFVVLGDARLLAERAAVVGVDWAALLRGGDADGAIATEAAARGTRVSVECIDIPLGVPCQVGQLDAGNGRYVLNLLDEAIDGARAGRYDAIVTAPLQKSTINDAGVPFTGHTEYLADRTVTEQVVMMLAGTGPKPLRVALATTHLPLSAVAGALSIDGIVRTLTIIDADLRRDFGLAAPRILVTGLNPHAGENGYLGREEIDIIRPALERAQASGIDARGPYPADTLFQPRYLADADCVLAMFHDQGLPVLKYATFGEGINVTLGLPIIRTSVDHGTALDLAGTGRADAGSMLAAIDTAVRMARNRRGRRGSSGSSDASAPQFGGATSEAVSLEGSHVVQRQTTPAASVAPHSVSSSKK